MGPWYEPFKGKVFLGGVLINAILAFFIMWAVRTHRGARVWLPLVMAMLLVSIVQGIAVLLWLCLEPQPSGINNPLEMGAMEMVEFEPPSDSDDE